MDVIFMSGRVKGWVDISWIRFSRILILWRFTLEFTAKFGFHRLLSKRFPYAIYYQIETGNVVVIFRVLDCRQNPRKTRATLKSTG
jgi:hypothetical protein